MADNPIKAPNSDVFTAYTSPYAAMLASDRDPVSSPLSKFALMMRAGSGAQGYADLLRQTNAQAAQVAEMQGGVDIAKAYLPEIADLAKVGLSGAVDVNQPYITVDTTRANQSDAVNLNATQQGALKDTAAALSDTAGMGYLPSQEDIGKMLTDPLSQTPLQVRPYVSYDDETSRINANAAMVNAQRPPSASGSGGGITISMSDTGFGEPTITARGKDPEAVRQALDQANGRQTPAAQGGIARPDVKARVAQLRAGGARIAVQGNKITATLPDGRSSVITVNSNGSGVEQRVK